MEVRLPIQIQTTALLQAGTQPLKVGEILRAVVQEQLEDRVFLLRLDGSGRTLTANSSASLQPGQMLELEVIKLGTIPELRVIPHSPDTGAAESPVQQALRQFLPKQEPLAEVIHELHQLIAQAGRTSALPATIMQMLAHLVDAIPKKSELATPEGLAKGLSNSGIFLEAKLAGDIGPVADAAVSDFKANLLRVLDRLKAHRTPDQPNAPTPESEPGSERIRQKIEAALARVVTDQLASLPTEDAAPSVWQLEIPFTDGPHHDAAKLLIAKDTGSGSEEADDYWAVSLELHPPGLGRFCARLVLKGHMIDTYLWSDTAATSELIREQCERLRARLHGAGLSVGQLTPLDRPPDSKPYDNISMPLVDLRA
jgi:hypothetical protein